MRKPISMVLWGFLWRSVTSIVIRYNGSTPLIILTFEKDGPLFYAVIDLHHPSLFLYGPNCNPRLECCLSGTEKYYDPDRYDTRKLSSFTQRYKEVTKDKEVNGTEYMGYMGGVILGDNGPLKIPVVEHASPFLNMGYTGLIGLGFTDKLEKDNIIRRVFERYDNHQMIIRRGPIANTWRRTIIMLKDVRGKYSFGEKTMDGCGEFTFFKTVKGRGWTLKGTDFDVVLDPESHTHLPEEIYDNHFLRKMRDEEEVPQVTFIPNGGQRYPINKQNVINYSGSALLTNVWSASIDYILLGNMFLAQYCLSLRANDKMEETEIGLAEAIPLPTDAKPRKLEDAESEEDHGDDDGGDGENNNSHEDGDDNNNNTFIVFPSKLVVTIFFLLITKQ